MYNESKVLSMPWKSRVKRHSERIASPTVVKKENRDFTFQFLELL